MSKITIITGSPRKDSNSNQMAQWFMSCYVQLWIIMASYMQLIVASQPFKLFGHNY